MVATIGLLHPDVPEIQPVQQVPRQLTAGSFISVGRFLVTCHNPFYPDTGPENQRSDDKKQDE